VNIDPREFSRHRDWAVEEANLFKEEKHMLGIRHIDKAVNLTGIIIEQLLQHCNLLIAYLRKLIVVSTAILIDNIGSIYPCIYINKLLILQ